MSPSNETLPLVLHEDDHLLVINKPAGWNTHSPAPFAGEGVSDWLRHRERRWASLAIIHRLDKDTSGVLVFGKTMEANRSLTEQFTARTVAKTYRLATDRPVRQESFTVASSLARVGDRYSSAAARSGAVRAETAFRVVERTAGRTVLTAQPITGRTHQIRVHAAESGFPILGDTQYGGSPAGRLWLHAQAISLRHPVGDETVTFQAPVDFERDPRLELRASMLRRALTDSCRLIHGAADGWSGWYVDCLGSFLLSQSERALTADQHQHLGVLREALQVSGDAPGDGGGGVYHKILSRHVLEARGGEISPSHVAGASAPERFEIRENGVRFELSFQEGYSVGLFLDQRDNRRRILTRHIAADFDLETREVGHLEMLNAFAYTCGFSVCGALGGARVTSLDLSRNYLEWGRRNFALNGLDPAQHDFIYGDAFDWLRRLGKKQRHFDIILLDPPTFSRSKEHGVFRAERDYSKLVAASLPLLKRGGLLFASTNAAELKPDRFLAMLEASIQSAGRFIYRLHYVPQPPDFPITRSEPAYLKTVWLRVD